MDDSIAFTKGMLLAIAIRRGTILYGSLAAALGIPIKTNADVAKLVPILNGVADESFAEHKIVLPVIVVAKTTNQPGKGFFAWCQANGFEVTTTEDRLQVVRRQSRRVYNHAVKLG